MKGGRAVFERDGFAAARITDIAAESGVAVGSFYTHFSSKEDLFAAVIDDATALMLVPDLPDDARFARDPVALIEASTRAYLETYMDVAGLMRAFEQVAMVDERFHQMRVERSRAFHERNAAAIARLQQAGLADPTLDPHLASAGLSSMVSRLAYGAFAVELYETDLDTLVANATRLWVNALQIDRAR